MKGGKKGIEEVIEEAIDRVDRGGQGRHGCLDAMDAWMRMKILERANSEG